MLEVNPVRAFSDNYIWLIRAPADPGAAVVVDPGQARPVDAVLEQRGLRLHAILVTHHHPDHVGGVAELAASHGARVFGPARERMPCDAQTLDDGDHVRLAELGLEFLVMALPGHTLGHIAYYGHGALFCGDTLFSGGCGRLFEGTPAQMLGSLDRIAALPDETRIYCAHEYTLGNLKFAASVEPGNCRRDRRARGHAGIARAGRHHGAVGTRARAQVQPVPPLPRTRGPQRSRGARPETLAGTVRRVRHRAFLEGRVPLMRRLSARLAPLALLGLGIALAGCSSTRTKDDYSSLPPSAAHPAGKARPDEPPGQVPPPLESFQQLPPDQYADLLDRVRAGYALTDVQHYGVDREVEGYRAKPEFLDRTFRRGSRYLHYIVTELERRGMPLELALLPVVESAFNPVAYSRSRAAGLWQFIPSTGKHYGLTQNWWIDDRRDVRHSTMAALDYLQYLNRYFNGDWYLAIAAYNGGEGTVSAAIQRNAAAGRPTDFFSLDLRAETRDYVPKLLAIRRIVGDPASLRPAVRADREPAVLRRGGPGPADRPRRGGCARGHLARRHVRAEPRVQPHDHAAQRAARAAAARRGRRAVPAGPAHGGRRGACRRDRRGAPDQHDARRSRGETLSAIARRYDVSIEQLRAANGLHGSTIQTGETLRIPGAAPASATAAEPSPHRARISQHSSRSTRNRAAASRRRRSTWSRPATRCGASRGATA